MSDPVELEIARGLASMRDQMRIPQPDNVIPFPVIRGPLSPMRELTGRFADALLAIERLADYMSVMAKQIERGNLERQKIIDMLRQGETSARDAAERLEG